MEDENSKSIFRKGYDWFCGYSDNTLEPLNLKEKKKQILKITSIKQDRRAVILLRSLLIVVLSIGIFIYVFFSV